MDSHTRSCGFYTSCRVRGTAEGYDSATMQGGRRGQEGHRCIVLVRPPLLRSFASLLFSPFYPPGRSSLHTLSASLPPSHPTWRTQRPSFSPPSHPLDPPCELSRVQSLTFHRARLIAAALTYCAIRCTRARSTFVCVVCL